MANFVFNIAKGRVAELVQRVDANDPANSALTIVAIKTAGIEADATLKDYADLAALLAAANDEATNSGYARIQLTDTGVTGFSVDNSGDLMKVVIGDQTWTAVAAAGGAWSKILVCYDPDTTGGTDSTIVPLTAHDFVVTPDGNDIVADFSATNGFYSAA